jgi:hypothetical protein
MALAASELESDRFIRVLLLGPPKCGKSVMAIASSPRPVRVFLCESDSALQSARRFVGDRFTFDRTRTHKAMLEALHTARRDVKKGRIKTLIVDPLSTMAGKLEEFCLKQTKTHSGADNGMKAYPMYNRILRQIREQLLDLQCHVIVITHYIESGGAEIANSTAQTGEGIVPMLAGRARAEFSAAFPDVVWMDYQAGKRVLVTGPQGAWGPGCRSLKDTHVLPADITSEKKRVGIRALIRAFERDLPPRAPTD